MCILVDFSKVEDFQSRVRKKNEKDGAEQCTMEAGGEYPGNRRVALIRI